MKCVVIVGLSFGILVEIENERMHVLDKRQDGISIIYVICLNLTYA